MKLTVWIAVVVMALLAGAAHAIVARPAPNLQWVTSAGKTQSLSAFRGQPVVVLIAPSPNNRAFRSQLARLKGVYERLGAQKAVFVAAFTQEPGRIPSNIPFALAADGPRVGFDYDAQEQFAIAIIGRDGNLDLLSNRVQPGQRVFDIIINSFVMQERLRRP